jgi:restriction system protein
MALWAVRAGKHGENENYALENNVVTIGWEDLGDLSGIKTRDALNELMEATFSDQKVTTRRVWTGEVWALRDRMQKGDLVVIPLKSRAALAVGRITGPYRYLKNGPAEGKHQRPVQWIRTDLPRNDVPPDILLSLGSTLTVFQVQRNNAEDRLLALLEGRQPKISEQDDDIPTEDEGTSDLEQLASDQIVNLIGRKFRTHDLARLVAGVLVAQGYKQLTSPPGADGGVDILAGTGPMGFDPPRLAVQVKSSDYPADVSVLRELQGVMPRFGAQQGLIVSWGGFKESVIKEARQLYFQIRLWDSAALVSALQENYERLPDDLQAELPLKRVWVLAQSEAGV